MTVAEVSTTRQVLPLGLSIFGLGVIAWLILGVTRPIEGWALWTLAVVVLGAASWLTRAHTFKLIAGHVLTVIVLAIGMTSLCASHCGQFPYYERFLGLPTAIAGMLLHAGLAAVAMISFRKQLPRWLYCSGLAGAIGASLFFAGLMLAQRHWCGSCASAHAIAVLMAVELMRLLRQPIERALYLALSASGALLLNLYYHHAAFPTTRNDPAELLSWMRGQERSLGIPIGIIEPTSHPTVDAPATDANATIDLDTQEGRDLAAALSSRGPAVQGRVEQQPPAGPRAGAVAPAPHQLNASTQDPAFLGIWGSAMALVKITAVLHPQCPNCALQWASIVQLREQIEQGGDFCVDIALTYATNDSGGDYAGRFACYLAYAAWYQGTPAMVGTLQAIFSEPGRQALLTAQQAYMSEDKTRRQRAFQELFALLPDGIDRDRLNRDLTERKSDIQAKIAGTVSRMAEYGVREAPVMWFYRNDQPSAKPFVILTGSKDPEAIIFTAGSAARKARANPEKE